MHIDMFINHALYFAKVYSTNIDIAIFFYWSDVGWRDIECIVVTLSAFAYHVVFSFSAVFTGWK